MAPISFEQFMEERLRFQHMMGDSQYTLEQLDRAIKGLAWLLLHLSETTTEAQKESAFTLLESAMIEHNMRSGYRCAMQIGG